MKLFLSTLILSCAAGFYASAAPLSPEQALSRLGNSSLTRGASNENLKLSFTSRLDNGDPGLYVFDKPANNGYVILSADDCGAPILGYSESGSFDAGNMPPQMKWWMEEYGRQIERARMNGSIPYIAGNTRADMKSISPLISTKWNQSSPYDRMTPEVDGRNCVTGCVATAMAQVMKFWNYPEIGVGQGTCTVSSDNGTESLTMSFDEQKFDWANMLNSYDNNASEEQINAVAYLMKACGYSTNMKYSLSASGTASIYIAEALAGNFKYNEHIQYCIRDYYTASEWTEMIYEELSEGRPVVYAGQSTEGGHCFVCDGYSFDGFFHFNWGWGGMSDGYFLLNALNPESLGIGANGGGYNFGQEIVRGIQPQTGREYPPMFVQQGNLSAKVSGNAFTLTASGTNGGWYNLDTQKITIDLGVKIEPMAPTTGNVIFNPIQTAQNQTLDVMYGWKQLTVPVSTSLANGTYKMTLCYRLSGTEEWTPVLVETSCYNSIVFTKNGTRFSVQKNATALPEIVKASLLTPLYYGEGCKISLTVKNPSEKELTESFYPALYSGGFPAMVGDGVTITLAPGEEVTQEFSTVFELVSGNLPPERDTEYTLHFYNPESDSNSATRLDYYAWEGLPVTMKLNDGNFDVEVTDFSMPGLNTTVIDNREFYVVDDPNEITFSCTVKNNGEYFAKPIIAFIFPYIPGEDVYNVDYTFFAPVPLLTQGEEGTFTSTLTFAVGEPDKSYFAALYVDGKSGWVPLSDNMVLFTISDNSAVEVLEADAAEVVSETVYNLGGQQVAAGVDALDGLPGGIYIVKTVFADGSSKTLKVIK